MGRESSWHTRPGAGVLVVRHDRVLMVHRARSGQTRWELPSGLAEGFESLEETARRETLEETGLAVAVHSLLCSVIMDVPGERYRGINAYFRAEAISDDEPHAGGAHEEPIDDVRFIDLRAIPSRLIHPVDRRVLNLWKRHPDRPPYFVHIIL